MSGQSQIPANYPHILVTESLPILPSIGSAGDMWNVTLPTQVHLTRMLRQSDLECVHEEDKDVKSVPGGDYVNWCRTVVIHRSPYMHCVNIRVTRAGDLALGTEEIFMMDCSFSILDLRTAHAGDYITEQLRRVDRGLTEQGCCTLGNSEVEFIISVMQKVLKQ